MQSLTSFPSDGPFTLGEPNVQSLNNGPFVVYEGDTRELYGRYVIIETRTRYIADAHAEELSVKVAIDTSPISWLSNRVRATSRHIARVWCPIHINVDAAFEKELTIDDALKFGMQHINPILDNIVVLHGLSQSVDIKVEHKLRHHAGLLRALALNNPKSKLQFWR